jgi:quercetin dioxygenase-like cupin family protein
MLVVDHRDRPTILSASGELSLSMVVNREVGASSLSIWMTCHKAGEVVPLHTHEVEEVLTVIAGEAMVTVGNDTDAAHADMSIIVPPRTPQGYRNTGIAPLCILAALADADAVLGKPWP